MSNFKIKIFTKINSEEYDDCIDVTYPCHYSCDNGVCRIKYTDENAGFTVIKISADGEVSIHRQNTSAIILREGYLHISDYVTPYGNIAMECTARSILYDLNELGGRLEYVADLVIGGVHQTNNVVIELISEEQKV